MADDMKDELVWPPVSPKMDDCIVITNKAKPDQLRKVRLQDVVMLLPEVAHKMNMTNAFMGKDGSSGANGKDGSIGAQGTSGAQGVDGKDGVPGKPGVDGKDGRDGAPGPAGPPGPASLAPAAVEDPKLYEKLYKELSTKLAKNADVGGKTHAPAMKGERGLDGLDGTSASYNYSSSLPSAAGYEEGALYFVTV